MIARVIHIWNTAGIGGLLARYLDRHYDYESVCVSSSRFDPYGHATEKTKVWKTKYSKIWILMALNVSRKADIIHIHSGIQWMPIFRSVFPNKKIVLHLHGTEIRGKWDDWSYHEKADMILVSTKDLLDGSPEDTLWLPNPVDEDLISKINDFKIKKEDGWAFHVNLSATVEAVEYAHENNLKLVIRNRKSEPQSHESFLKAISHFEYYIDVKRGPPGTAHSDKILPALSITGLEALALGCKVIDWKGEVNEGLPEHHESEKVAELLHGFYDWGWKNED